MNRSRSIFAAGFLLGTVFGCGGLLAREQVDYLRRIKPVLAARCLACHGVLQQNAGLRLDTAAFILKGARSGPVVRRGNPAASPLLRRVLAPEHGGRMPPEGEPLKPEEIQAVEGWIRQGAPVPPGEKPEQDPREHWAFRPVRKPVVSPQNGGAAANPIDAFIAQRQRRLGVRPQPEAPRPILIRRLYFDLVGLPPSPDELAALEADRAPGWYDRLVDRLLKDPRHGERWGRHWMDIWRYSDWWGLGDQLRNSQPHIWHWRDWIVESLNADTPYDEMVRLMLAADELYPNDLSRLRASGFLARNWFLFNRNQWMEETVEHVSKGFLGLTVNCAKCHDHKYDPIQQADFYKLRAFFEPYHVRMDAVPGEPDLARDGIPRAFDGQPETPTYLFIRGQESRPDKSTPLAPGVPALLAFKPLEIRPVALPVEAWQPERRPWVVDAHRTAARDKEAAAREALERARASGDASVIRLAELTFEVEKAETVRVECVASAMQAGWAARKEPAEQSRIAAVRAERGVAEARARLAVQALETLKPGAKAPPEKELAAARAVLAQATARVSAPVGPDDRFTPFAGAQWTPTRFLFSGKDDPAVPFAPRSTGRRTALAEWITNRRNPLTARVAVNHIWTRHMGAPLVATMFDFGRKSSPPTHPELLDWLAAEFMERGWSMKHLHRLIVTSAAYRRSSSTRGGAASQSKDPDNRTLWRREAIRLEAEAVRDSILQLAGTLDPTRGGPSIPPAQQGDSRRRSLYFWHSDISRSLLLETFDGAAVRECYRRDQSIVPQQALALTNSALVLDAAGPIAARLSNDTPDDVSFLRRAFTVVLGIEASDPEIAAGTRALAAWRAQEAGAARRHFIWTLLNHNDFVTLR